MEQWDEKQISSTAHGKALTISKKQTSKKLKWTENRDVLDCKRHV